jgi:hypothetical protein
VQFWPLISRRKYGNIISDNYLNLSNLHLAGARVFVACGAAEVFDEHAEDDKLNMSEVPVDFGVHSRQRAHA